MTQWALWSNVLVDLLAFWAVAVLARRYIRRGGHPYLTGAGWFMAAVAVAFATSLLFDLAALRGWELAWFNPVRRGYRMLIMLAGLVLLARLEGLKWPWDR